MAVVAILTLVGVLWLIDVYGGDRDAADPSMDYVAEDYESDDGRDGTSGLEGLGGLFGSAAEPLSTGEVDAQVAEDVVDALGDLGDYESRREEGEFTDVASGVLEDYRAQGVELVFADYLGLLEDTWACLVKGDRWVEICIVREDEGDGTNKVETVRLDADALQAALPPELFEPGRIEAIEQELDGLLNPGGDGDEAPAEGDRP